MKRLGAFLICLCMIIMSVPTISVAAETTTGGYEDWKYEYVDGKVTVTSCNKRAEDARIPASIQVTVGGVKKTGVVAAIADNAFRGCANLVSVSIPGSVKSIGKEAFAYCNKLETVGLADGITSIGDRAFYNCSALGSITIPASVTSIGKDAFTGCEKLKSINVEEKLDSDQSTIPTEIVGDLAVVDGFYSEESASEYLTANGAGSFTWVSGKGLAINPSTPLTLDRDVVSNWLTPDTNSAVEFKVTVDGSKHNETTYITGMLNILNDPTSGNNRNIVYRWDAGSFGLTACYEQAEVTINKKFPAFNASGLTTFSILVTEDAGDNTLSAYIKKDGDAEYTLLVENVMAQQQGNRLALDVKSGAEGALYLESIRVYGADKENSSYTSVNGVLYNKAKTKLIAYPGGKSGAFAIPSGVTTIGDSAFEGCSGLTGVTIPATVTSIENEAFFLCENLDSPTIPNSVKTIGDSAFSHCGSITQVAIPGTVTFVDKNAFSFCENLESAEIGNGVTTIGEGAFSGCESLTEITIPASVTTLGNNTFSGCAALENIEVDGNNKNYSSLDGNLYSTGNIILHTYAAGKQETEFSIPNTVVGLKENAFAGSKNLENIVIPSSVVSIGDYAFYDCTGLKEISIPSSVASVGSGAFYGCTGLTDIYYGGSEQTWSNNFVYGNDDVPANVTVHFGSTARGTEDGLEYEIIDGEAVIIGCDLDVTDVIIPNRIGGWPVTKISAGAFENCESLENVEIPDTIVYIGDNAFKNCKSLEVVVLPNFLESVGSGVFSGCENLRQAIFLSDIQRIENWMFSDCRNLTEIRIPKYVWGIGEYAFSGCVSLKSVTIPNKITVVENYAFAGCESLVDVTIPDGVGEIGHGAFAGCSSLKKITLPSGVSKIGDKAFENCSNLSIVNLSANLNLVGLGAFDSCPALIGVNYGGSADAWNNVIFEDLNKNLFSANVFFGSTGVASTPGDVNNDSVINVKDAVALKIYLVFSQFGIDETAADLDDDGTVTEDDLNILRQYLVGDLSEM